MIKVGIADAHSVTRAGIRSLLEAEHDIEIAGESSDGDSTLRLVQTTPLDVLTLGLVMPGIRGADLIREIRQRDLSPRIVVVTMLSNENDARRCFAAGASGFVLKSGRANEILVAVRQVAAGGTYVSAGVAERFSARLDMPREANPHDGLTRREREVLRRLACGESVSEIAAALGLSIKTVSTYKARILQALGLDSVAALVRYAIAHRIVDRE